MQDVETLARWIEQHHRIGDAGLRDIMLARPVRRHGADDLPFEAGTASGSSPIAEKWLRLAERLLACGTRVLLLGDPSYPARLRLELSDSAPPVLYVRGNLKLFGAAAVAIIGTRRPSAHGQTAAQSYAAGFVKAGYAIVSGNAPGIDAIAHQQALESGGATIVFPPVPMEQFEAAFPLPVSQDHWLVASPFVPGSEVQPWCFLRRNSLVAALCRAALVAETGTRGGTLDTVRKLGQLHRPIFVSQLPPAARHANAHDLLIRGGANPVPLRCTARATQIVSNAAEQPRMRPAQPPCLPLFDAAADCTP